MSSPCFVTNQQVLRQWYMTEGKQPARWLRRFSPCQLGGVLVGLGAVLMLWRMIDLPRLILSFVDWVRQAGLIGVLSFSLVYLGAAVLLVPASILTLGAGFVWGPLLGLVVVLPSALVSATVAFLLGRTVARSWVQERVAGSRFRAIDEAVEHGGVRLVVLLRLSPLFPFHLLNYSLGLTRLSARDYLVGTAIGMVPGTFLYLYLGSLVTSASQLASGERPAGLLGTAFSAVGFVATVVVTVWVTRTARTALSKTLSRAQDTAP